MEISKHTNNKRIAKNTILLYLRQIITMLVSLYTSRVVLNALGVVDYGIYNVVGGIVMMFSFLTTTMASASQRYLSYDLSEGKKEKLKQTFSLIMVSYIAITIIVFLLAEVIAVWFLNSQMNIPDDRLYAANWVLQFSILTFCINLLSAPYMSVVIAREHMNVYAYASIADVLLKLGVVYFLLVLDLDKLIVYSILMFFATLIITYYYRFYCKKNFPESKFSFFYDKQRLLEMSAFASWNVMGAISNVLRSQGINILLNLFFNPSINAARGIAYQVNTAITNFTNNFYTAVRPQIIKRYAEGNLNSMFVLVFTSSKLAFFLLLLIAVPVLFETDALLTLWLKNVPEYTPLFVRLVLVNSLLEVLNYPLVNAIQATGRIKTYQLIVSVCYLMNVPLAYIALRKGYPPESTMIINLILILLCFWPRLLICKKEFGLSISEYIKKVIQKIILVTLLVCFFSYYMHLFIFSDNKFVDIMMHVFFILFTSVLIICFLGMNKAERAKIQSMIHSKMTKNKIM